MNAATLVVADSEPCPGPAAGAPGPALAATRITVVGAAADLPPGGACGVVDDPLELARFTHWTTAPSGERRGVSSLQLSGMHCAACAGQIETALLAVPGVHAARVAAASRRAIITWDPLRTRPSAWLAAVRAAGYDAAPDAAAPARALRQHEARQALWRLFVAAFCAMQVMMLATPGYVASAGEIGADLRRLLDWGGWLMTLPVMAFSCAPFFAGAWRSLRTRQLGMDVPVSLGVVITFVASSGAAFDPGGVFGSEVYFDSLTMFVSFLLGARWLEMRARHRAAEELEASLARMPETAERVRADGRSESVSVLRLERGDLVRVALGQAFPADGELVDGPTQCDESLLSGESVPVPRGPGDPLVAGSLNVGVPVLMRVQRVGPDTRYEGIVALMRSAATTRPALARLADRWAVPFLWAVLVLAAGGAAAWSVIDPTRAVWVAVAVLVVTCPCALSLAAPATLLAASRALARRGVLVCRLDAIEVLARVDRVFFDKTGTLTSDVPRVAAVVLCDAGHRELGHESAAFAAAAQLAAASRHPLSQALVVAAGVHASAGNAACASARTAGPRLTQIVEHPGLGLQAIDERGRPWRLGLRAWVDAGQAASHPEARVWLGVDGTALAGFAIEESLREGALEAVAALRRQGVQVTLLSGDREAPVRTLAARLGIDDVIAEATPADKLSVLSAAQACGQRVAMVGDGINDAPVLARADVAVAMGQGALLARSQADAVLTAGRPLDLVEARRVAQRAVRIVHQNLLWAAAYNAASVPLALAGWLPPWAAGLGMAFSSLWVVAHATRAAR